MDIPADLLELLRSPSTCYLATSMPDGSPQLTQTWVDTDGERVVINTVEGHQKVRNVRRDPRVALTISGPAEPASYVQIRGTVVDLVTEGAAEHIEELSQRYTGQSYNRAWAGPDQVRVMLYIQPERLSGIR